MATCYDCGRALDINGTTLPRSITGAFGVEYFCDDCTANRAKRHEEAAIKKMADRQKEWAGFCPVAYFKTNPAKLPNQEAYNAAMRWQYGPRGILLHGPTGTGKSRTAWELMKVAFFAKHDCRAINCMAAFEYSAQFSRSCEDAVKWVKKLSSVSLVLMDDIFKVKLTESFEAALFAIVTTRIENELPIIATMNDTSESLKTRISTDRADPLIRRLTEGCEQIAFI